MKFTINLDTTPIEVFESLKAIANMWQVGHTLIVLKSGRDTELTVSAISIEGAPEGEAPPLCVEIDECGRRKRR